jgi:effector-binding domain-containing protein
MAGVIVSVQEVPSRKLAAVRREVSVEEIAAAWRPALDQVWAFLRERPGLRTDGHNVFLYHHERGPGLMRVDFGVEVVRAFEPVGDVFATETPSGKVALAVHVGSYQKLRQTHTAIHEWCAEHGRQLAGKSWEVYGDWTDDESKLETTVAYLLS